MIMTDIDTLIVNAVILTLDGEEGLIPVGQLAVHGDRIVDLGPWQPESEWAAREIIDAGGHLVMPGMVNTHTHLPMTLFRGLADDLPLDKWLQEHIFPAEARYVTPENVAVGTRLAAAEMLLSGTTCCSDGYFLSDQVAETLDQCGMRAIAAQGVIDFPAPGVPDPDRKIDVARDHIRQWRQRSDRVVPAVFCHAPYTCSAETLKAAKAVADEAGVLYQIHVAETRFEREQCIANNGCSPVAYLHQLGVLDEQTLVVHAVWVDEDDMDIMARCNCGVAHCPESNMKLASGVAPVPDMLAAGIRVGLGTDGCASNNDLDLFGEMDTTAKLHKVHRLDPTVMTADRVLRMATIEGARTLGLDRAIGSLEKGKQADLIIVDLNRPHLTPRYNVVSHLVYAARGGDVLHVMIGGRWVVRDRRLTTIDEDKVLAAAGEIGRDILANGSTYHQEGLA